MQSDFLSTCVGVAVCIGLSAAGTFYILGSMDRQAKSHVREGLKSNSIGPLDDQLSDIAGVPRRPKPKFVLPQSNPIQVELNFD